MQQEGMVILSLDVWNLTSLFNTTTSVSRFKDCGPFFHHHHHQPLLLNPSIAHTSWESFLLVETIDLARSPY